MKTTFTLLLILTWSFSAIAQNETTQLNGLQTIEVVSNKIAIKKIDPISESPKTQKKDLIYKKSTEIISIKAYIRSLQLKQKTSVNC